MKSSKGVKIFHSLFSSFLSPCLVVVRAPDTIGLKKSSGHLYCANCGKLAGKLITQQSMKYAYMFNARIVEFRSLRRANKYFFTPTEMLRPMALQRIMLNEERRLFPQNEEENSNPNEQDGSPEERTIELEIETAQQEPPKRIHCRVRLQYPRKWKLFPVTKMRC